MLNHPSLNDIAAADVLGYAVVGCVALTLLLTIWTLVVVRKIKRRVDGIGSRSPVSPTPEMIKYWRKKLAANKPGTPKHKAYRKALVDAGETVPR